MYIINFQIESVSSEEKLSGLQMLASVCENKHCIDSFIKYKVVKIVGPLLLDRSSEVRSAAAGALRYNKHEYGIGYSHMIL